MSNARNNQTPAPWTHRAGNNTTNDYVKGPDGELIAMVYAPYPSANARLISAAPDLLQAARNTVSYYEATQPGARCLIDQLNPCGDVKHWGGGDGCPLCSARSAIARTAL